QGIGIVITPAQLRVRLTGGARNTDVVIPVCHHALKSSQQTVRLGSGVYFTATTGHTAPTISDRLTIVQLVGAKVTGQCIINPIVGGAGARVPGVRAKG